MSQSSSAELNPASHSPAPAGYGRLVELSTDGIPAADRLAFWRDMVLKRTQPQAVRNGHPFEARLKRIVLERCELVEHASDAVQALRAPGRSRFEGGDDIAVELMRECRSALLDHDGEHRLKADDLYVVDFAKPMQVIRSRHCSSGIVLSRRRVIEVMGEDLSSLAGRRIATRGMAGILRQHLKLTMDEAPCMSEAERVVATNAAAEMALAILQSTRVAACDAGQFADGFHVAAKRLIDKHCGDPDLTPDRVASVLGCSRASLYRVFSRWGEGVAEAIWTARIERAWRLLASPEGADLRISDVAMLCGFRELPTFTRMFKRRYGETPRDTRQRSRSPD